MTKIKNFLFHRVSDENDEYWPPMRPALFKWMLRYISKGHLLISLEDYLANPGDYAGIDRPLATIMFDDGYKDNIEYAVPIFQEMGFPASFYVVTSSISSGVPPWTYVLDHTLRHTTKSQLYFIYDWVPVQLRTIDMSSAKKFALKPFMKQLSHRRRLELMKALMDQTNDTSISEQLMLNWEDLRQMQSAGFCIGSHSCTHPLLSALENESDIYSELYNSREVIKNKLGHFPASISYPNGSFDQRVIDNAKAVGYEYGLALKQRPFNTDNDSLYEIPRIELYQEPEWKARLRISGVYNKVKTLIS